jgi:hypothetical protein
MTYPSGRVLNYKYASGVDDRINRLTSLSDNTGTLDLIFADPNLDSLSWIATLDVLLDL